MALYFKNPTAKIKQLQQDFEAAEKTADPVARLLAYRKTGDESAALHDKIERVKMNALTVAAFTGIAAGFIGVAIFGFMTIPSSLMASAGAYLPAIGSYLLARASGINRRSMATIAKLRDNSRQTMDKVINETDMVAITRSPLFDKGMEDFPALRNRVMLDASYALMQAASATVKAPSSLGEYLAARLKHDDAFRNTFAKYASAGPGTSPAPKAYKPSAGPKP